MTREEAKELLPIIQAFAEGKTVQFMDNNIGKWIECNKPNFYGDIKYRIKPEPKFRPFKNTEECWEEMQKHQPFGWIKNKDDRSYIVISALDQDNITVNANRLWDFDDLMNCYTFADNEPFGIKQI